MGEVDKVKEYLVNSPDASIFLHGRNYNGDSTLIIASREKSSVMVSLLLDDGSKVDAMNAEGRSALMEAAL